MVEFVLSHAMVEVRPTVAFGIIERELEFATRATRWRWSASGGDRVELGD